MEKPQTYDVVSVDSTKVHGDRVTCDALSKLGVERLHPELCKARVHPDLVVVFDEEGLGLLPDGWEDVARLLVMNAPPRGLLEKVDGVLPSLDLSQDSFLASVVMAIRMRDSRAGEWFSRFHYQTLRQVTGGAIHDFNNLMTGVIGNLSLLKLDMMDAALDPECLEEAEQASIRVEALLGSLREFVQLDLAERKEEMVALGVFAGEMLGLLRAMVRQSRGISLTVESEASVLAPKPLLELLVFGLVEVAREDLAEGDGLEIRIYEHSATGLDEAAKLEISRSRPLNGGEGFSASQRERLWVCRTLARRCQAGLDVEVLKEGLVLSISLPLGQKEKNRPNKRQKKQVLIVDDELAVLRVTMKMLSKIGYEVVSASTARRGLEALDERDFDVVILDYLLPDMSGEKLLDEVLAMRPGTPVILTSGYGREIAQLAKGRADTSILEKPFSLATLAAQMNEILGTGT